MIDRHGFGYVVALEQSTVRINLLDAHRGQMAGHSQGISPVLDPGTPFGVDGGPVIYVLRVRALSFLEPREAHRAGVGTTSVLSEPLRIMEAFVIGVLMRREGRLSFNADSGVSPALGAAAYPLMPQEMLALLDDGDHTQRVTLGTDVRAGLTVTTGVRSLLGRHVAVLGGTGQGKSCFTAAILQQLVQRPNARIVVFDVNGEYADALRPHAGLAYHETVLGGAAPTMKIPYYALVRRPGTSIRVVGRAGGSPREGPRPFLGGARGEGTSLLCKRSGPLREYIGTEGRFAERGSNFRADVLGRHGLSRMLLPSEKTQRPALAFALENLSKVEWDVTAKGLRLPGGPPVLFDDCRTAGAAAADHALQALRGGGAPSVRSWPPMLALGALVAESHSIKAGRNGPERDPFLYGNVSPLVTRVRRFVEDPRFGEVIDVRGTTTATAPLSWSAEGRAVVDQIFGTSGAPWRVHVIDLRNVVHDLMPMVLGSLLELFALTLFERGQASAYPTLLVLEEAHHYLRQVADGDDPEKTALAYERLSKEGRKFGLSLWVSTQRPSEVSPTVLAQCATWAVFRLSGESDLKAVASAGEWADRDELRRIAALPRQHALVFGAGIPLPVRLRAATASPTPRSHDPDFSRWG